MRLALFAIVAGLVAAPAAAQPTGTQTSQIMEITGPPLTPQALARLKAAAELADQNRRSEALNAEVHNRLRAVDARNAATKAAYDKAMADYREQVARHDADAAKVQADYAKAQDAWKAAVAACKKGDVSKCAQPDSKAAAP